MEDKHEEVTALREKLLDFTEPGPVSQWIDRMGELVRQSGFPTSVLGMINWNTSPKFVAHSIADKMVWQPCLAKFKELIKPR